MLSPSSVRRTAGGLVLAAAFTVAAAAPTAEARPPVGKIFDCYTFTSLGLTYVQALELKTSKVYLVAPFRKGNGLSGKPAKGLYRAKGNHITWRTGAYKGYKGTFTPGSKKGRARIDIERLDGSSTGVSCEQH